MLSQLNLIIWAWIESFKDLKRRQVWLPFLILAAVQIFFVLLMTQFYRPGLNTILVPLLGRLSDPAALHYPQFYMALPAIFSQVNLFLDWAVGSFIFGAAALIVWHVALGMGERPSWKVAMRRYWELLLVRLPIALALIAIALFVPLVLMPGGEPLRGNDLRMVRYGTFLVGVCIEMLFVFAPLIMLVESRSFWDGWLSGWKLVARVPLATFLIVLIPNMAQLPTSWALRRTDVVVQNLSPELVAALLCVSVLVYVVINYFIVASAVRVYGARGAGAGGEVAWNA